MRLGRGERLKGLVIGLVVLGTAAFLVGLCWPISGDVFSSDDSQSFTDGLGVGMPVAVPPETVRVPPLEFLGLHPSLRVSPPALFHFTPACSCRSPPGCPC